ncbi:hypothetical protein [Flavobacterium sp. FlaQc-50]|jgi:hypothetical protein|uniref:hypothetical protein n=1 Tax=unclassified Flavobacterium TaxID=196869 RepID=UPI00375819CF
MTVEKYTDQQLSGLVIQLIFKIYNNPEKILESFQGNIARKVRSLHLKKLTAAEIQEASLKVAALTFKDLNTIPKEYIRSKLSREITSKSYQEGIELSQYRDYFSDLAKDMVRDLIQRKYNLAKQQRDQVLKKRKK